MTDSSKSTPLAVTIAAIIFVPIITGILGWQAGNNSVKKDYVQIAAQIVQNEKNPKPLRLWAGKLLNEMSPIPFEESVEDSIAVPAGGIRDLSKSFIFLPKTFLDERFTEGCATIDTIIGRDNVIEDAETKALAKAYMECELRMRSTREAIAEMDKVPSTILRDGN